MKTTIMDYDRGYMRAILNSLRPKAQMVYSLNTWTLRARILISEFQGPRAWVAKSSGGSTVYCSARLGYSGFQA